MVWQDASKARLASLLGGPETPTLLVTSGHGVVAGPDDPNLRRVLGGLLCSDWPGPEAREPLSPDWYFSADDLSDDADLLGLVAIHLASFGAGSRADDPAFVSASDLPPRTGWGDSLAPLAQWMLGHPRGGALAVVGYAGSGTWSHPWAKSDVSTRALPLSHALRRLMAGQPLGYALEDFGNDYAQSAVQLLMEVEDLDFGKRLDPMALASLWVQTNETSQLVILGDPAVRLDPSVWR